MDNSSALASKSAMTFCIFAGQCQNAVTKPGAHTLLNMTVQVVGPTVVGWSSSGVDMLVETSPEDVTDAGFVVESVLSWIV